MKIICLNTWGGRIFKPLISFFKSQSSSTDLFCLQEIYSSLDKEKHRDIRANLLEEIKKILPGYTPIFFPSLTGFDTEQPPEEVNFELEYGNAIFVKKNAEVKSYQNFFVFRDNNKLKRDLSNIPTPLQKIIIGYQDESTHNPFGRVSSLDRTSSGFGKPATLQSGFYRDKKFAILNFHGTSYPANKLDSENRLAEATIVKKILDDTLCSKIIIGDFNQLPQTKSLQIISEGLRNLIDEYKIEMTRSKLSPYFGKPDFQKFADYAFISKDINLKKFEVLNEAVSDHLPLVLEIE